MAKTKLRWEYPPQEEMHGVMVNDIENIGLDGISELRSCLHGCNEQGAVVKTLYCSRDGRFYVRYADGWHKLMPVISQKQLSNNRASGWSGSWHPCMRHYGTKHCHLLVAHAWLGPRPAGCQCDHINGNLLDWCADNLQWVTPQENRRRAGLMRRMRKIGLQPKWLYYGTLRALYSLSTLEAELVINRFRFEAGGIDEAFTTERINMIFECLMDEIDPLPL